MAKRMASNIDPSQPISGSPTTQSVRDNFAAAQLEIGELQNADAALVVRVDAHDSDIAQNTADIQSLSGSAIPPQRTLTAGTGLGGGGDLTADRTFDVGQGTGITVTADSVSLNVSYTDNRYAPKVHTHAASDVISGTFDNARISQSNVTQHSAAIDSGKVGGYSIVVDTGSPSGTDPNTIYFVV